MHPMQPIRHRTPSVVANAELNTGRREMVAGALGLALAKTRAAVALPEDELKGELPKAEDFTSYNKVQTKKGFEKSASAAAPGSVGLEPGLVPVVAVGAAAVTAGVPLLLNAGQTAKDSQDAQINAKKTKK